MVSFVFSANQKPFVLCTRVTNFALVLQICTRVTEELRFFLSQSELNNSFVYINYYITNIGQVTGAHNPERLTSQVRHQ